MTKFSIRSVFLAWVTGMFVASAGAAVVSPSDTTWVRDGSGSGSVQITATLPDDNGGLGSLEFQGAGAVYYKHDFGDQEHSLEDITAALFSWAVGSGSASVPELRLHVSLGDGDVVDLVWRLLNPGGATPNSWESSTDAFVLVDSDGILVGQDPAADSQGVSDWSGYFLDIGVDAWLRGISVGLATGDQGPSFADLVTLEFVNTDNGPRAPLVFDFEPGATQVPEPASLALVSLALLAVGAAGRRRMKG